MNRFQVVKNTSGKYNVIDTDNEKLCAYSGKPQNPPLYLGESSCLYSEWDNYYSALGFADGLEWINK